MELSTIATKKAGGLINGEETTDYAQATNFEAVITTGQVSLSQTFKIVGA